MRDAIRALALLLAFSACAPSYETRYRLEPPADAQSPAARSCLARCSAESDACLDAARQTLTDCENRATLRQTSCQSKADLDFRICQAASADTGRMCVRRLCQRQICRPVAIESCEADHRRCFQACGGSVVEERRCVANCPS
jgi:hypothetical protein